MKFRKVIVSILTVTLSIFLLSANTINAANFEGNESYYNNFCSGPDANASAANKQLCSDYNAYLREKANQSESNIEEYKGQMAQYQDDLKDRKSVV